MFMLQNSPHPSYRSQATLTHTYRCCYRDHILFTAAGAQMSKAGISALTRRDKNMATGRLTARSNVDRCTTMPTEHWASTISRRYPIHVVPVTAVIDIRSLLSASSETGADQLLPAEYGDGHMCTRRYRHMMIYGKKVLVNDMTNCCDW